MTPNGGASQDEATRALVRDVGRRSVEQLGEGVTRMIGETSALSRWLLTMLVALNGAGVWYCLAHVEPGAGDLLGAAAMFFFVGALVALLAAIVGLVVAVPATGAMRAAIAVWTEVASSGALTDEALDAARRVRRMGLVWMAAIAFFAFVSLALFLGGAATVSARLGALPAAAALETEPAPTPLDAPAPSAGGAATNEAQPMAGQAAPVPAPAPTPTPSPAARRAADPPRPAARAPRPAPSAAPRRPAAPAPRPAVRPTPSSVPPAMTPPPMLPVGPPAPGPSAPPPAPSPS